MYNYQLRAGSKAATAHSTAPGCCWHTFRPWHGWQAVQLHNNHVQESCLKAYCNVCLAVELLQREHCTSSEALSGHCMMGCLS